MATDAPPGVGLGAASEGARHAGVDRGEVWWRRVRAALYRCTKFDRSISTGRVADALVDLISGHIPGAVDTKLEWTIVRQWIHRRHDQGAAARLHQDVDRSAVLIDQFDVVLVAVGAGVHGFVKDQKQAVVGGEVVLRIKRVRRTQAGSRRVGGNHRVELCGRQAEHHVGRCFCHPQEVEFQGSCGFDEQRALANDGHTGDLHTQERLVEHRVAGEVGGRDRRVKGEVHEQRCLVVVGVFVGRTIWIAHEKTGRVAGEPDRDITGLQVGRNFAAQTNIEAG